MGTKSSTGMPGGYPRVARAMPSRYPGGSSDHWSDADAPIIAGHYLSSLLRPHKGSGDVVQGARMLSARHLQRGAQNRVLSLAACGAALWATLRCTWLALKRLVFGPGHHLAATGTCFSPLKRSSVVPGKQGRGHH